MNPSIKKIIVYRGLITVYIPSKKIMMAQTV